MKQLIIKTDNQDIIYQPNQCIDHDAMAQFKQANEKAFWGNESYLNVIRRLSHM